ncbi:MAG: NAD(P)-dependent oxidoreductase [Phyllobacteriaceae bacterium]|nr:NAD(P)-dependent oxidoreductase [Phyllobacteriaceae bacterium]
MAEPSFETALVTGATGYVGSRLAARLVGLGKRVHVVARPGSRLDLLAPIADRLTVHRHDGTTEGLVAIVADARPDVAFHLASNFIAQHVTADVAGLVGANLLFPTQLLEALASAHVDRLIATGTSWQHYEDAPYRPVDLYAATKQAFEDVLAYYADACGMKATTLVLFDTYGPRDPRGKLVSLLWRTARAGRPLAMSPGEQKLDLVHVDDVVEAYLVAAALLDGRAEPTRRYGVATGRPLALRESVAIFERATGLRVPIAWGERPYRPREVMTPWTTWDALPGWTARIALEDGLIGTEPDGV